MIAIEEQLRTLKGIIYLIRNKINNKIYIGQTVNTFFQRYNRVNWWKKIESPYLLNSIHKYGIENFEIEILEYNKTLNELNILEKKYILKYKSKFRKHGYNIREGGKNESYGKNRAENKISVERKPKRNKEQFVLDAIKKYGNKYDYTNTVYIDQHHRINIHCNDCDNDFDTLPSNHLAKNGKRSGCSTCRKLKARNRYARPDIFLKKALELHKNKFDYSLMNFVNYHTKIKIKCNKCGNFFERTPRNQLRSINCPCHETLYASRKKK